MCVNQQKLDYIDAMTLKVCDFSCRKDKFLGFAYHKTQDICYCCNDLNEYYYDEILTKNSIDTYKINQGNISNMI